MTPVAEWQGLKPPEPLSLLLQSHQDSGTKEADGEAQLLRGLHRGHHLCKAMHLQQLLSPLDTHQFARERPLLNAMHKKQSDKKEIHMAY